MTIYPCFSNASVVSVIEELRPNVCRYGERCHVSQSLEHDEKRWKLVLSIYRTIRFQVYAGS